jgi:hypothetical protein
VPAAAVEAAVAPGASAVAAAPRTTSGELAARNLTAQIDGLERAGRRAALAEALLVRAEMLGKPGDYDRALAAADAAVADAPADADGRRARAVVLSHLHRFDEALAECDTAERLGAPASRLAPVRAAVALAREDVEAARAWGATTAALAAAAGDDDAAIAGFLEALRAPRDTSPFPAAWTYFQVGMLEQRGGRLARARDYHRAAVERLPGYAAAAVHLAEVEAATGDAAQAVARMQVLLPASDDPDVPATLARLLGPDDPQAARLRERARAGYAALEAKHPLAFADHAARFWLADGDAPRAWRLAQLNLANRETDESLALALDAAFAAQPPAAEHCALADRAASRPAPSAYLLFAAARAYRGCGRDHDAEAALARTATATRDR